MDYSSLFDDGDGCGCGSAHGDDSAAPAAEEATEEASE
jgi:hypothetical protein